MYSTRELEGQLRKHTGEGGFSVVALNYPEMRCVLSLPLARKHECSALEAKARALLESLGFSAIHVIHTVHEEASAPPPRQQAQWNTTPIAGVRKVIAVASGKGGVGKSTMTMALAYTAASSGLKVGVLDADIYGPSIPHMLGLQNKGQPVLRDSKMVPFEAHGIKAMSVGFIMGEQAAMLRGPMITKTLHQMLRLTDWGALDVLLVDMPPGTGDVTISLCQQAPVNGVVLVTTPQQIATIDAKKCALAFQKLQVPLLAVIENMSWLEQADGNKQALFGQDGGTALAKEFGVETLVQIPLNPTIGTHTEAGTPWREVRLQPITELFA